MEPDNIVIAGLPSPRVRALTEALGLRRLEEVTSAEASSRLHEPPDAGSSQPTAALAAHLGNGGCALVVYPTPWGFLEQRVAAAGVAPDSEEAFSRFAQDTLGFWHAYHASLLGLRDRHEAGCLLLRGELPIEADAAAELVKQRFGVLPRGKTPWIPRTDHDLSTPLEEVFWQIARDRSPGSLDLYDTLESCAELFGRQPRFGFDRFPPRKVDWTEALPRAGSSANPPAPSAHTGGEAELYLLQLHQAQSDLARIFEQERRKDQQIADLKQLLKHGRLGSIKRAGEKAADIALASIARLTAPLGVGNRIEAFRRRIALKWQAAIVRSSGLFDEEWYLAQYPDVAKTGHDPLEHFLKFGVADGRNPSDQFETLWYLRLYPDVARTGLNPLLHYIEFGRYEGRRPRRERA